MRLRIHSAFTKLGFDLATDLENKKLGSPRVTIEAVDRFALHYSPKLKPREISELLDAFWPFAPEQVQANPELEDVEAVLWLGLPADSPERICNIYTDSPLFGDQTRARLSGFGVNPTVSQICIVDSDQLRYYDVPRLQVQAIRWSLLRQGVNVAVTEDSGYSGMFALWLRDPQLLSKPLRQRYSLEVQADDTALGQGLIDELTSHGFQCLPLRLLTPEEALTQPIVVRGGPFTSDRNPSEYSRIRGVVTDYARRLGIDPVRYPFLSEGSSGEIYTRVVAPLIACRDRKRRPYAGPYPDRFQVTIVTDNKEAVAGLKERLEAVGFTEVSILTRRSLVEGMDDGTAGEFWPGFAISWNGAGREPSIASMLKEAVKAEMDKIKAEGFFLRTFDYTSAGGDNVVRIYFPIRGLDDGKLLEAVAYPGRYYLTINTPNPDEWRDLEADLRRWGFASVTLQTSAEQPLELYYGNAPLELIEKLRTTIRSYASVDLRPSKAWSDSEMYVTFYVPNRKGAARPGGTTGPDGQQKLPEEHDPQLDTWAYGEGNNGEPRPFVEVTSETVRVGGVVLPRHPGARHQLAPHPASFGHFCLDRLTGQTLEHLATSVLLREPCLLEGETSTSKTSSILYLAALLNQPIVRINLNGQTDTGELIGRFVPQHLILELPVESQELLAAAHLLEAETRMILEKARAENRPLTRVEIQQVMANEEMVSHPWRWEDGLVPQAMKNGWWVLLDELNLAEPQILERLNSVLETEPSLVLTEYDNSVIGPTGTPVHVNFRIFATMNPAEYAGRSVLSPAYRDRWRGYRFVPRPGEDEFLDMLRLLVFGEQPDCTVNGCHYAGGEQEPRYGRLAALPNIEKYLEALARFQVALEHAVGQSGDGVARIGSRRRERYVFTRRGLLSLLDYLGSPLYEQKSQLNEHAVRRGLLRYYLGRLSSADDRSMVIRLLDAHGIGPNTWTL